MIIYLPTRGRADSQLTFESIPAAWRRNTVFVAHEDDADALEGRGSHVLRHRLSGIHEVRRFIMEQHVGDKIIIADDDFHLMRRRNDDRTKFASWQAFSPTDFNEMMGVFENVLDHVAVAGIGRRTLGHLDTDPFLFCRRSFGWHALNVEWCRDLGITMSRLPLHEDTDGILTSLTKGIPNVVVNDFAVDDPRGSNAPGGCSIYRTSQAVTEASQALAALWPGLVTLRRVPARQGMEGDYLSPVVAWKKAFERGRTYRTLIGLPEIVLPEWMSPDA